MKNTISASSFVYMNQATLVLGSSGSKSTALARAVTPLNGIVVDEMLGASLVNQMHHLMNPSTLDRFMNSSTEQFFVETNLRTLKTLEKKLEKLNDDRPVVCHELLNKHMLDIADNFSQTYLAIRRPIDIVLSRAKKEFRLSEQQIFSLSPNVVKLLCQTLQSKCIQPYSELLDFINSKVSLDNIKVIDTTNIDSNFFHLEDQIVVDDGNLVHASRAGSTETLSHSFYYPTRSSTNGKIAIKMVPAHQINSLRESRNQDDNHAYLHKIKAMSTPGLMIELENLEAECETGNRLLKLISDGATPEARELRQKFIRADEIFGTLKAVSKQKAILRNRPEAL